MGEAEMCIYMYIVNFFGNVYTYTKAAQTSLEGS